MLPDNKNTPKNPASHKRAVDPKEAPPGYLDQIHELSEKDCSPELWKQLRGNADEKSEDDDKLPF